MQRRLLTVAILCAIHQNALAQDEADSANLGSMVVTAPAMEEPLTVVTDPKAPRQPLPAHDGADYLKTIPGFSVIRKGGTDGDPVLRGMAASRISILQDGELILGGCGNRMDPPTAYIYPESFDKVTVIKGPQTVLYGPVGSAGTVLFDRDPIRFAEPGWNAYGSVLFGSFGRNDQVLGASGGSESFYVRGGATRSDMDDYQDGDGKDVHSKYTRWSNDLAVGWTPDANTTLELSTVRSDGEAAYADRTMDGVKFDRSNWGVKFERRNISDLVEKVEANAYYNYVDHVMDNYTLRTKTASMFMISNPDRETTGMRLAAVLRTSPDTRATVGIDQQRNIHTLRSASGMTVPDIESKPRVEDATFSNIGVFGEVEHLMGDYDRVIAGLRADSWTAEDKRGAVITKTGTGAYTVANPTSGESRDKVLTSGFMRHEHDFGETTTLYTGFGHSQRFPDYWELISASKESETTASAFNTKPENTTQLDVGVIRNAGPWHLSVAGFINRIDDFILVQNNVLKTGSLTGADPRTVSIVRNVDAETWGAEAGLGWKSGRWNLDGSIAYVKGDNTTDGAPLAQLPPLETRLGAEYATGVWSVGGLVRIVAKQDRVDIGSGNIVGQDIGETDGFTVFSINGSWKPKKGVVLAAGVDNLLDETYAEHISRSGSMIAGYEQTTRVNEPGRNYWVKASIKLD
ncbi:MAG: TonB-dependent copper receptor [Gammaproteobacteria bacterium HGW-Gammaproteobacteria-1]|jgi:iron complex outermembrane receptor protein|nr:MAG: TonB-dependent copper receptor [Gammaproteobacteria bacterium HGW-Gammaproteobacteria-1]